MATYNNPYDLISEASMKGWRFLWASQIRSMCRTDQDFAQAVRTAENMGLEVRGGFTYSESKALSEIFA